jgi:hypothetical protein
MIIRQIFGPLVPRESNTKEKKCSKESEQFNLCIVSKKPIEICKDFLKTYHKCLSNATKDTK